MIHEIDKTESLAYWKEILAGAEEDEHDSSNLMEVCKEAYKGAIKRWTEDRTKLLNLRTKVREMEDSNG